MSISGGVDCTWDLPRRTALYGDRADRAAGREHGRSPADGAAPRRGPEAGQLWGHYSPLRASGLHWPFFTAAGEGSQSITPQTFNLCSLTPGTSTLSWGGALPSLLGPSGLRALPDLLELSDTPQVGFPFEEHGLVPMAKLTIMGHAAGSATLEVGGGYSSDGAPESLHRTRGGPCQAANIPRPCLGLWH